MNNGGSIEAPLAARYAAAHPEFPPLNNGGSIEANHPPGLYQFQVNTGPFGATLNFLLSDATPVAPGTMPQSTKQATIRMSLEHLKIMAFMLRRQILQHESQAGVRIDLPRAVINAIGVGPEDWESFWRSP